MNQNNILWGVGDYGKLIKYKTTITSVEDPWEGNNIPQLFMISQNFPNPYNSQTTISYSIPNNSFVQIQIFDILGREVSTLLNEEKAAGNYKINGTDYINIGSLTLTFTASLGQNFVCLNSAGWTWE